MATDAEIAAKIKAIETNDVECQHFDADEILCELLRELGYTHTVEAFEELERWYA